ncbi:MAG: hypothetical protein JWL77_2336 [Chthonomonadaceae bacterium]|nr:hypothetical protein [Chthonomonadaceae bacterium]
MSERATGESLGEDISMQQQFSSEESKPFGNPSENGPMVQARIDAYLNQTCAPLFLSLSQEEAMQQRAEMRSHLESLVEAHVELGFSEAEAVTLALEQFGKEQNVVRAWKQECEETRVEAGRGTFWSAIRPVVGYSALNWAVFVMLAELYSFLINGYSGVDGRPANLLMAAGILVFFGQYTLFPAFLGYLVGRRTRGKVLVASLLALPFIVQMCGLLAFETYWALGLFLPPHGVQSDVSPLLYLVPNGFYFGFGALGAAAALWKRRRTLRLAGSR